MDPHIHMGISLLKMDKIAILPAFSACCHVFKHIWDLEMACQASKGQFVVCKYVLVHTLSIAICILKANVYRCIGYTILKVEETDGFK